MTCRFWAVFLFSLVVACHGVSHSASRFSQLCLPSNPSLCANTTCALATHTHRRSTSPRTLTRSYKRVINQRDACGLGHDVVFRVETGAAGGFGDRLMGMVTTFYLAVVTEAAFSVDWTSPYSLSDYFVVPSFASSTACTLPSSNLTIAAIDPPNWTLFTKNGTPSFVPGQRTEIMTNARHWAEVVGDMYAKSAACLHLDKLSRRALFKLATDILLQPSLKLRTAYQNLTAQLSQESTIVGVQIRTGGDGIGWSDPSRHPPDSASCFAEQAVKLCAHQLSCIIFLTTDSAKAASMFRQAVATHENAPRVLETAGVITHTDRSSPESVANDGSNPWLKSVLDWWALRSAHYLVVSRSGYGETAAWASGRPAKRLRFEEVRPFECVFEDV